MHAQSQGTPRASVATPTIPPGLVCPPLPFKGLWPRFKQPRGGRTKWSFVHFPRPGLLPPVLALQLAHAWSGAEAGRLLGASRGAKPTLACVRSAPGACDSPYLRSGLVSVSGQAPSHCGCRFPGIPTFSHSSLAQDVSVCSVPSAASFLEFSLCEF